MNEYIGKDWDEYNEKDYFHIYIMIKILHVFMFVMVIKLKISS